MNLLVSDYQQNGCPYVMEYTGTCAYLVIYMYMDDPD